MNSLVIKQGDLSATIMNFGASLSELRLKGHAGSLVLGYPLPEDHVNDSQFMGAVIGRYANRIANGSVPDLQDNVLLDLNERGTTHLHGGSSGFSNATWQVNKASTHAASLSLHSAAGDMGYPGNLRVQADYEICNGNSLRLALKATADAKTIINLCHHPYFNLDGKDTVDHHKLQINADRYLPTTSGLIPTGAIEKTTGTAFDYSQLRFVEAGPYNNTYCLHNEQQALLTHAATLAAGCLSMQLWTTQPGLHLYDGYKLRNSSNGHNNKKYGPRSGLCLEAQAWPDSPNHSHFPTVVLGKNTVYEQVTEYRFYRV